MTVMLCIAGKTSGDAGQVPDRLHRCIAWVQECKRAVSELRSEVKAAVSHREKCCMTLSAAMAAVLALESVRHLTHPSLTCFIDRILYLLSLLLIGIVWPCALIPSYIARCRSFAFTRWWSSQTRALLCSLSILGT